MGRPELAGDGIFGTIGKREAAREQVDALVTEWTRVRPRHEVIRLCDQEQVPAGPVNSISEIFEDPHFQARENIAFVKDARVGELAIPNVVPRLTATPGRIDHLGPALGADNDDVLGGLLGLSKERMRELAAAGVI
jgi:crotonobetainyl-CoA:carnitine CoA-transferase CaiB-like acyl-CoA transferase